MKELLIMHKELDEKLCKKYPEIFRDRHGDIRQTAMVWGFSCGDGWYDIIDFLCSQIMSRVAMRKRMVDHISKILNQDKSSWNEWMHNAYTQEKLIEAQQEYQKAVDAIPVAFQVKEKFGGLRFYISGGDEYVRNLIHFVEQLSFRVCEECGTMKDVVTYAIGWNRTLCPEHAKQHYGDEAYQYRNKTGEWAE